MKTFNAIQDQISLAGLAGDPLRGTVVKTGSYRGFNFEIRRYGAGLRPEDKTYMGIIEDGIETEIYGSIAEAVAEVKKGIDEHAEEANG